MPTNTAYILYDIPGTATKQQSWSPNVWKTRIVLNYKGIPHKTEWVEYPDIATVAKRIGAPHTLLRRGQPSYTVPILRDPATNRSLAGSLQIALNLERLYPDLPKLFPPGTEDLSKTLTISSSIPRTCAQLHEESKTYFRTTRERMYGGALETFSAPGAATAARWLAVGEALEPFARDADARGASDTFLLGERETYADIVAACWLGWARRVWGADTEEWAELETWHGGRWGRLTRKFKKWEYVDTPSTPDLAKCVFPLLVVSMLLKILCPLCTGFNNNLLWKDLLDSWTLWG
ncbi:hypothetical protein BJV74DRAFT_859858 [Russula compacta]|nr:hypothetical protein BJV74DRAFT_859858 [Russula compacta]